MARFGAILACGLAWCCVLSQAPYPQARAAEEDSGDPLPSRKIQQKLASTKPADRIAAWQILKDSPNAETAKLAVQRGLKDAAPEVRLAAYQVLLKCKNNQHACTFLLSTLGKELHRKNSADSSAAMLSVLLFSELPQVEREAVKFIDQHQADKDGAAVVVSLIDHFSGLEDEARLQLLLKLSKLQVFSREYAFRRGVVNAIMEIQRPETVGVVIELMPQIQGEVLGDIVSFLTQATGQNFGVDAAAWDNWWKADRQIFKFPAGAIRVADRVPAAGGSSSYYGLPVYSQRMVFIMDVSNSMVGPRLAAAKRELIGAIQTLRENVSFSVLVFSSDVTPWQRKLVPATAENKRAAINFVDSQDVRARTASYNALEASFSFDAESFYFLTDGAPNGGKFDDPATIVELISKANRSRRISINTLGIGVGEPGGLFDVFLSKLAENNWGVYRRVDE